jgi:glycosyltransferase involved in cell wall biosynthesis
MAKPVGVSIVIPTYNRAALLTEAVCTVQAQTCADWELIIVDDGSTDDTRARIAALADPRIQLIPAPHSGNLSRVRNLGAARATGFWIAFLDSDDLWVPEKLMLQLDALCGSGARWCYGPHGLIDAAGRPRPLRAGSFAPHAGRILGHLLREETSAFIGTLLIERALFGEVGGFDETLRMRGDLDLALRLAAAAEAAVVPETLALVREHAARTTHGLAEPHLASAAVFERVAAREGDPEFVALAEAKRAALIEAAARSRRRPLLRTLLAGLRSLR